MLVIHKHDVTSDYDYVFKTVIRSFTFMSLHKIHENEKIYSCKKNKIFPEYTFLLFYCPLQIIV